MFNNMPCMTLSFETWRSTSGGSLDGIHGMESRLRRIFASTITRRPTNCTCRIQWRHRIHHHHIPTRFTFAYDLMSESTNPFASMFSSTKKLDSALESISPLWMATRCTQGIVFRRISRLQHLHMCLNAS
eukprot:PhF_6_TR5534/c0_g1_i1/m.7864